MSFDEIYATYGDTVYGFLKFKLREEQLVEDVMQDTFLAVYQSLQKRPVVTSWKAWILSITHHRMVDHLRKKHLVEVELDEALPMEDPGENSFVREMLEKLDDTARTIIYGLYVEQLTCEDLGSMLGIPAGTVKSRAYAARTKLRSWLKEGVQ